MHVHGWRADKKGVLGSGEVADPRGLRSDMPNRRQEGRQVSGMTGAKKAELACRNQRNRSGEYAVGELG